MPADAEIHARLLAALEFAHQAQQFILRHYSPRGTRFEIKPDGSPVTIADRGAEELIRARLAREFPLDGIIGEEHGDSPGRSDFRWVLDPVDGTKSFVHGVPLFGTLIGVQQRNTTDPEAVDGWLSVAGVARFPALDECIWASRGAGAWHTTRLGGSQPSPARVSTTSTLSASTISTTCLTFMLGDEYRDRFVRLCAAARLGRGWSDCYGTLLVATGQIEAMIDPPMKLWDVAALQPIVSEAGGRLSGWDGRPTDGSTGAIASNALVHAEVLHILREAL